ncbi:MAG: TolC family protein [Candidatus Omnitrophota bacterium]
MLFNNGGAVKKVLFAAVIGIICFSGKLFYKFDDTLFAQNLTEESLSENATSTEDDVSAKDNLSEEEIVYYNKKILTLDDCIDIAVKNSKEMEISLEKIGLAELKKKVALRDLFPSLAVSWSSVLGEDAISETPDYQGAQYGVEAEQEIWPRDFIKYSFLQAGKNLNFNEINYKKTKEDLIYETKKAFYELAKAKKDLEKQLEISKKAENLYDLVEKKQSAGLISQLEYLKAVSRYKEIASRQKTKEYFLKLAKVKLRNLLKLDKDIALDIIAGDTFNGPDAQLPSITKDGEQEVLMNYLDMALSNRLDMEMQNAKVDFYEYGEKAAKGKGKPKISFLSSLKKVGNAYAPDEIEYENEWFVGTKVSIPWFGNSFEYTYETGKSVPNRSSTYSTSNESDTTQQSIKLGVLNNLSYYYDRREAEIAYKSAINEKEEAAAKVILETAQAFYLYKKSVISANANLEKLKYSYKQEEIIDAMRQLGEETISSSLNALVELEQAEVDYNQSLLEYCVSILELDKAVGREILAVR